MAALLLAGCLSLAESKQEDLSLCLEGSRASQVGRYEQALGLFDRCIDHGHLTRFSLGRTYRNIGAAYRAKGEPGKAAEYYGYSLALGPSDPWDDYLNRGGAWADAGQDAKALADYDQALALRPDYDEARFARGLVYERMGLRAEAHADFKRAYDLGMRGEPLLERLRPYTAAGLDGAKRAPGGPFDALGSTYEVGPAAPAKSLGAFWEDHSSCRDGNESNEKAAYPGAESFRASGRFEFPGGNVAVTFPQLAGVERLDVRIRLNDTWRGVRDDSLAFAGAEAGPSVAAVVRTILPERMQGSPQTHKAILQQVEGQSVGLATIGVSRYFARRELLLEISLIVRIPPEVPIPKQGEYARERMNEFMGSISIL